MTTYDLHPGLAPVAHALDRVEPILLIETARARRQLADALAPITQSVWPEISHRLSLLTNTGIPVEFSWSTRHPALRWTAEVAGPETPKEERLTIAGERAGVDVRWLQAIQADRHLRYGAWLGGRHLGERDDFKVYAEIPTGAAVSTPWHDPALDDLAMEWRIGGAGANGSIELYGRGDIDLGAIGRCERAAFGATGQIADAVTRLISGRELPRRSLFSIAFGQDGTVDSLTWFGFAQRLFASHEESIDALVRQCSDDTSERLLRALAAGPDDGRWRVGMIGARLDAGGSTSFQAAVRPS